MAALLYGKNSPTHALRKGGWLPAEQVTRNILELQADATEGVALLRHAAKHCDEEYVLYCDHPCRLSADICVSGTNVRLKDTELKYT